MLPSLVIANGGAQPQLIPAVEKHGHLSLNPALYEQLLNVSASSIDRLLKARTTAGKKHIQAVNHVTRIKEGVSTVSDKLR
ncbi:hypothetical protein I5M74_22465 [Serratia marcescens]|nr:hypothetical protein [Serratia marcescens]